MKKQKLPFGKINDQRKFIQSLKKGGSEMGEWAEYEAIKEDQERILIHTNFYRILEDICKKGGNYERQHNHQKTARPR